MAWVSLRRGCGEEDEAPPATIRQRLLNVAIATPPSRPSPWPCWEYLWRPAGVHILASAGWSTSAWASTLPCIGDQRPGGAAAWNASSTAGRASGDYVSLPISVRSSPGTCRGLSTWASGSSWAWTWPATGWWPWWGRGAKDLHPVCPGPAGGGQRADGGGHYHHPHSAPPRPAPGGGADAGAPAGRPGRARGGHRGDGLPGGQALRRGNPEELRRAADVVLVEADGAERLPLKAPAEYEPVIPPAPAP